MRFKIIILLLITDFAFYTSKAQTSVKEPFFVKTVTKTKGGGLKTSMKTPDGKLFEIGSSEEHEDLFFINGKSYTEAEAMQLDPTAFKAQQFNVDFAWFYEIEGRDLSRYIQIFYTGQPPPLSAFTINTRAVSAKYTGKTITGLVKGPSYSSYNNLLTGFILESGKQEFRVSITMNEVSRLMKAITPGDIVIIEIGHASLGKDSPLPVIMPKTLTKDGERLIQKGSVQI